MALTAFNEDMEIISKLSDLPNDTDGLTSAELKAKFDEAGLIGQGTHERFLVEEAKFQAKTDAKGK